MLVGEPGVPTCIFTAPYAPPDPNEVHVYVDGQFVPQDAADGWTFGADARVIVLTGSYCDRLRSAESCEIEILFGCGPGGG
jgi:hypothetical protein